MKMITAKEHAAKSEATVAKAKAAADKAAARFVAVKKMACLLALRAAAKRYLHPIDDQLYIEVHNTGGNNYPLITVQLQGGTSGTGEISFALGQEAAISISGIPTHDGFGFADLAQLCKFMNEILDRAAGDMDFSNLPDGRNVIMGKRRD